MAGGAKNVLSDMFRVKGNFDGVCFGPWPRRRSEALDRPNTTFVKLGVYGLRHLRGELPFQFVDRFYFLDRCWNSHATIDYRKVVVELVRHVLIRTWILPNFHGAEGFDFRSWHFWDFLLH